MAIQINYGNTNTTWWHKYIMATQKYHGRPEKNCPIIGFPHKKKFRQTIILLGIFLLLVLIKVNRAPHNFPAGPLVGPKGPTISQHMATYSPHIQVPMLLTLDCPSSPHMFFFSLFLRNILSIFNACLTFYRPSQNLFGIQHLII